MPQHPTAGSSSAGFAAPSAGSVALPIGERSRSSTTAMRRNSSPQPHVGGGRGNSSSRREMQQHQEVMAAVGSAGSSSEEYDSEDQDGSDVTGSELEDMTWVEWFCTLKGNEHFVVVDEDFIRDDFNLTGLASHVPLFEEALDIILDNEQSEEDEDEDEQGKTALAEEAAERLYGLVHARFLATTRGLQLLQQKYTQKQFGVCPNSGCDNWPLLPNAVTDTPQRVNTKVFCAKCCELYHPPKGSRLNHIDGAYFGSSIAQIFYMQFPFLLPPAVSSYYVPKVFGFKVHPGVKTRLRIQQQQRPPPPSQLPLDPQTQQQRKILLSHQTHPPQSQPHQSPPPHQSSPLPHTQAPAPPPPAHSPQQTHHSITHHPQASLSSTQTPLQAQGSPLQHPQQHFIQRLVGASGGTEEQVRGPVAQQHHSMLSQMHQKQAQQRRGGEEVVEVVVDEEECMQQQQLQQQQQQRQEQPEEEEDSRLLHVGRLLGSSGSGAAGSCTSRHVLVAQSSRSGTGSRNVGRGGEGGGAAAAAGGGAGSVVE